MHKVDFPIGYVRGLYSPGHFLRNSEWANQTHSRGERERGKKVLPHRSAYPKFNLLSIKAKNF